MLVQLYIRVGVDAVVQVEELKLIFKILQVHQLFKLVTYDHDKVDHGTLKSQILIQLV